MNKTPEFFNKHAVVSYSGGMDSTCLVLDLMSRGYNVSAYSFDYGQNHSVELERAAENAKYMQSLGLPIQHQIINVRDVFSGDTSTLVQHTKAPEGDYRDETMKSTCVTNRNVIFSAIIFAKALSMAKREKTNVVISLGVHAGDHAIYPDCTEESTSMARELYRISNWDSDLVDYETPFVNISKDKVLRAGLDAMNELGLTNDEQSHILAHTISCYNATPDGKSCGKCGTCTERLESFKMNGLKDPAPYINE